MIIPTLETERLILREWRESDLENFAKFRMNKNAARFVSAVDTVGDAWREMVYHAGHWLLRGFGMWSVELKETAENIGQCGPYYPQQWPEPEIGWSIFPEFQHNGYGTEAANAALNYAYSKLGWTTAISLIASENAPSIALAKRLGAVAESEKIYNDTPCTIYRHLSPSQFLKH
jgi:RimJ/RimL family protein N-acetyltransferase